jgi:hypothetical protein
MVYNMLYILIFIKNQTLIVKKFTVKGSVVVGNQRKDKLPERTINIWNRYDFAMCGLGNKCKLLALFKHTMRCITWSKQRIVRGYSDSDVWEMFTYLQTIIPDMLQNLKENRHGSPGIRKTRTI